jgi:hypothetical protein
MSKKIPIHFNKDDERATEEMVGLIGLTNTYGAIPKALKFSITLSKNYIEWLEKVIPDLKPDEIDLLFSSIKKLKMERYKAQQIQKLQNDGQKV